MRVLLIGGTGMFGKYISRLLVERGDEVVLVTRGNVAATAFPGCRSLQSDRSDYGEFEARMREAGAFDVVIDLVGYKPADGESVVRAFAGRVGQYIFCSTVDVYAKPAARYPYTESEGYGGLNEYSRNKVALEKCLIAAAESGAFPLTILRPAYTYCEGRSPIHPISWGRYLDRVRKGKPIVVHGDGQSLWSCNHAADVSAVFVAACGNPISFNQAYHITGEEWLTWNQYHGQVAEALGVPCPRMVHIPSEILSRLGVEICVENFQFNNIFDNSKAKRDLGYQYTVTWMEGVRRMAGWFDEHPDCLENSDSDLKEDRIVEEWDRGASSIVRRFCEAC